MLHFALCPETVSQTATSHPRETSRHFHTLSYSCWPINICTIPENISRHFTAANMLVLAPALLLSSVVAARNLAPRQNSTAQAPAVYAQFPEFGPSAGAGISGVLEFKNNNGNAEIISSGDSALHNFPAGLGPFLYHSMISFLYLAHCSSCQSCSFEWVLWCRWCTFRSW